MAGSFTAKLSLGALPKELLAEAKGHPRLAATAVDAAINAAGPYLWRKLAQATPSGATGQLREACYFERTESAGTVAGFVGYHGGPSLYAVFADQGRRPGRRPPRAPIAYWARRKLGLSTAEADRAAFLIARKIGRSGTPKQEFVKKTADKERAKAEALMVRAAIAAIKAAGVTVRGAA